MKYRFDDKEAYTASAHKETLMEIREMLVPKIIGELIATPVIQPPIIKLSPFEVAAAIMDGSIRTWNVYKSTYSRKIGDYLIGKPIPKIKRIGSSYTSPHQRKTFGEINSIEDINRKENNS